MSIRETFLRARAPAARLAAVLVVVLASSFESAPAADVERGRYLVLISGCNDCHTPGYALGEGAVPESEWLTGDVLGWRGPWGTTYPSNLRLFMQPLSEDDWLTLARNMRPRPPMPWFNLRHMTDDDLRSVYRYVRSLEPLGSPAPAYVPPEQTPPPPFVQFP
ncbi:MAG: cytochrome c [Gammaproteobacteria bacterium]|nr:cytochrome c [Gammaproteobacteria bacterium]